MPVIREQRRVGGVQPGGVVAPTAADTYARSVASLAGQFAEVGQQFGRVAEGIATDDAAAIAANTRIVVGKDGVPQIEGGARHFLLRSAQKVYDKTLDSRFDQRLTLTLQEKADTLALEHEGDPAGFHAAWQASVEGMTDAVPEKFRGHWEDTVSAISRGYGAEIGKTQLARSNAAALRDVEDLKGNIFTTLSDRVVAGDLAAADAVAADMTERVNALYDRGLLGEQALAEAEGAISGARAWGMMRAKSNDESWTSGRWLAEAEAVQAGAGGYSAMLFDATQRNKVVGAMQARANMMSNRENAEALAAKAEGERLRRASGGAEANDTNAKLLDGDYNWTGKDWMAEPMTDADWQGIKNSNMVPYSLYNQLNSIRSTDDEGQRKKLYQHYLQLTQGTNIDGMATEMRRRLPASVRDTYEQIAILQEVKGTYSIGEALDLIKAAEEANPEVLVSAMQDAFPQAGRPYEAGKINGQVGAWLQRKLANDLGGWFSTAQVPKEVSTSAETIFKGLVNNNVAPSTAYAQTLRLVEGLATETSYTSDATGRAMSRSFYAPERLLAVPGSWGGTFLDTGEKFAITGVRLMKDPGFARLSTGDKTATTYAAIRDPWMIEAERQIYAQIDRVAEADGGAEAWLTTRASGPGEFGKEFIYPGDHYMLEPIQTGMGGKKYRVIGKLPDGTTTPLGMVVDFGSWHTAETERRIGLGAGRYDPETIRSNRDVTNAANALAPDERKLWREYQQKRASQLGGKLGLSSLARDWQVFSETDLPNYRARTDK